MTKEERKQMTDELIRMLERLEELSIEPMSIKWTRKIRKNWIQLE